MDENVYYDNYMDSNDAEQYDPFEEDPRYKRYYKIKRIVKFATKTLVYVLVFGVVAALIFRVYTIQEPDMASQFIWNEKGIEAYNKYKDFTVFGQKMQSYMWTDPDTGESKEIERDSFNGGEEIGDQTMSISNIRFVKRLGQLQVTFRWNQNAEKNLLSDFNIDTLPSGELFRFTLTDEKGNMYGDVSYTSGSRYIYEYRRLVFDGIDFTTVNELYLNVYFSGHPSLTSYEELIVYDRYIESYEIEVEAPKGVTKGLVNTGK